MIVWKDSECGVMWFLFAIGTSIEALASDTDLPSYVFEGPGEILSMKENYAQIRWRRPVPDVWVELNQLKEYIVGE